MRNDCHATGSTRLMLAVLKFFWALPNTLVGYAVGILGLLSGGRVLRRHGIVLEFHGGFVSWFLSRLPNGDFVMAMTLGYSILGKTEAALDITRGHELVHVEQYGRWGPMFLPAYLYFSLSIMLRGGDPYRDNPFEIEAYSREPVQGGRPPDDAGTDGEE